ncbi:uncharacterized protein LTR77_010063 [Saxophila tyrrhenica]|uniref:Catechol 1,2-dioxygenase n=1 Tax=Saxophila tyrrhenica TaxID=1690608 RepID=A0AAV9NWU1_9PEZI|nr:hypothetical protein LTR77_010063 [Saxophila tyrrhenica]
MSANGEQPVGHVPQENGLRINGDTTNGSSRFDPDFTDSVINATGPKTNPRVKSVVASLIRHMHDFCRENEITVTEFMAGVDMLNRAGQMSDEKRNEGLLLLDVLGIETLVDEITHKVVSEAHDLPTATAVLGPFWRKDAPIYKMGESIVQNSDDGERALVHGKALDFDTGKPIANAEIDVWHTGSNGLYENQDPSQPDMNLRGRFYTNDDGSYHFYCLRPTRYPIPLDGPGGQLLELLDRHPYRPAHIHFILSAEGYKPLVTQIFDRRDEYIDNDTVFAVKDSLVVDFKQRNGDEKAEFELEYDFRLVGFGAAHRK